MSFTDKKRVNIISDVHGREFDVPDMEGVVARVVECSYSVVGHAGTFAYELWDKEGDRCIGQMCEGGSFDIRNSEDALESIVSTCEDALEGFDLDRYVSSLRNQRILNENVASKYC